jgi:hypothetical protein
MKHISGLLDFGLGRRCAIVGGGLSLNRFRWDLIDKDIYMICINRHMRGLANMIIYYDKEMMKFYEKYGETVPHETLLVGFQHGKSINCCKRCNYYYGNNDIIFGDSGFHALQIAQNIFNFSEIFLIGYDYETQKRTYHWNEEVSDQHKMNKFTKHSIGRVLPMYKKFEWTNRIYNCNKESKLDLFTYGVPYDTDN